MSESIQVRLLSRAIQDDPDAPGNYLLRAEEWLVMGDTTRARADFERAQTLTEALLEHASWGYVYQAYLDRVEVGLRLCAKD